MAGSDGAIGLGPARLRSRLRQYRTFHQARAFAHSLGLKSKTEWIEYCKSGKKPFDIPADPNAVYANSGWAGWGDWLGTGRIATTYVNIDLSRKHVRSCAALV